MPDTKPAERPKIPPPPPRQPDPDLIGYIERSNKREPRQSEPVDQPSDD